MIKLFLFLALSTAQYDVTKVRELFTVAHEQEQACEELLNMTDGYTIDYKPTAYAYHVAAEMTMANHATWPGTKLQYFKKGRIKLEAVVKKNMDNVEIRYIRFAVQHGSPAFLDYKDDMDEDKRYIQANVDDADLPSDLKETIKATIAQ